MEQDSLIIYDQDDEIECQPRIHKRYSTAKAADMKFRIRRDTQNLPENANAEAVLREKYTTSLNELQSAKYELNQANRRLEQMHSVLVRELGSESLVVDALSDRTGNGWVGRAEEILELKKRIRISQSISSSQPVSIVVDNRRISELEGIIEKQKQELAEVNLQRKAHKARLDTLEARLTEYKNDIKLLLEKNDLNNQVIAQLQKCMKNSNCSIFYCIYTSKKT
jgi:hypothetical protein